MKQLVFLEPVFILRSETGTIAPQIAKNITLYGSIEDHAPFVLARLEDNRGISFSTFKDFAIGTKFTLYVMSFNESLIKELDEGGDILDIARGNNEIYEIGDFYLSGSSSVMEDPNTGDLSIELALAHRTMIEHDATVECFSRQSFNQLHTRLANWLIDKGFVKNEKRFNSTEGTATDIVYRYRIGMSRFEYLTKYLAPKMTLDKMGAYAFIDDMGYYNFKNIKQMYEMDSKVLLILGDNNKISKDKGFLTSYNFKGKVSVKVGGENFQKQVKAINAVSKYDFYARKETIYGTIKLMTRRTNEDCYPIKKALKVNPTDFTIVWGDGIGELISRAITKTKDLDSLMTFEGVVNGFIGTQVQVGQRVDILYANPASNEVPHWVSGGWVLSDVVHTYILGQGVQSSVKLKRPTLIAKECGIDNLYLSEFHVPFVEEGSGGTSGSSGGRTSSPKKENPDSISNFSPTDGTIMEST